MVLWAGIWIWEVTIFIINVYKLHAYEPYRKVLIMNDISLQAKFINFLNIAYILYKSSKMVDLKHEPQS